MGTDWEARLEAWRVELDVLARVEGTSWVPLAEAESTAGVSRSAVRAWYRNGEIASRLVDGPHGPQRLVPLEAVLERAAQSPKIRRKASREASREASLEAQMTLLRSRLDQLEIRLAALERPPPPHR